MAKNKNDYFQLIEKQANFCVQSSTFLSEILCNYTASNIPKQNEKIHKIKIASNQLYGHILSCLSQEFITPIEREDILHLVQIINEITNTLDKVILQFYMFNIHETPVYAPSLSKEAVNCVNALFESIKELRNFKKNTTLNRLLDEVLLAESNTNKIFVEAIHHLFTKEKNCAILISHKAIYKCLEDCCCQCKLAAEIIMQIIIKNT